MVRGDVAAAAGDLADDVEGGRDRGLPTLLFTGKWSGGDQHCQVHLDADPCQG